MSKQVMNDILKASRSDAEFELIRPIEHRCEYENQLLFFFKPECFMRQYMGKFVSFAEAVISKMERFEVHTSGIAVLSGSFLGSHQIMDRHYGFINQMSKGASRLLEPRDLMKMLEQVETGMKMAPIVLGGHECLRQYEEFDAISLNELWLSKKSKKLRSGLYYQLFEIRGQKVLLINAFHPMQLSHYIDPARKIIVLLLYSNTKWSRLRDDLVGDTYPERAKPNSIRRDLLDYRNRYIARGVSVAHNFVHMSAGPFEAMFEIRNFLTAAFGDQIDPHKLLVAVRMQKAGYTPVLVEEAVTNPLIPFEGKSVPLFDLSEHKDTSNAISLLEKQIEH